MPGVVLQHELLGHLREVALGLVGEIEGLAVGEDAVADLEDLGVGVGAVERDRDSVERADRLAGDALALEQRAHGAQAVALERRLLELLRGGRRAHAGLQVVLDRAVAAGEEVDHAVDVAAVVLLGDVADAGGLAALDVVVQARAAAAPAGLGSGAGAEHEDLREQVEGAAHALGVGVGTEVGAPGPVALAGEVDAREVLVEGDRDEGVGLVVAQADVEARAVLLDEALLGEQRLGLGGDDEALDVLDAAHHLGMARAAWHIGFGEVRGDALADRLGLADVEHAALAVAEQVDAGLVGKAAALLGDPLLGCGSRIKHHESTISSAAHPSHHGICTVFLAGDARGGGAAPRRTAYSGPLRGDRREGQRAARGAPPAAWYRALDGRTFGGRVDVRACRRAFVVALSLVLDTGPLLAALDAADPDHERCAALLGESAEDLVVPMLVLAELDYWCHRRLGVGAWVIFLDDLLAGVYRLEVASAADLRRCRELQTQYRDQALGVVDASVLALVERLGEDRLATLDHRHFSILRPAHTEALELLPQ